MISLAVKPMMAAALVPSVSTVFNLPWKPARGDMTDANIIYFYRDVFMNAERVHPFFFTQITPF